MLDVIRTAIRIADTKASVLIRGETGTGKALLARFLHERSRRWTGPFVAVSCLHPMLSVEGLVREANGGTLFLDNVTELSATAQVDLLRVFEDAADEDAAGRSHRSVDVRFVAGTDRVIEEVLDSGRLRRDLYYRIAVLELELPPLRERGDDIRMLAEHFVGTFASANGGEAFAIARETLAVLRAHPWPGNVRQLRDALERATSVASGPVIVPTHLPIDALDVEMVRPAHSEEMLRLDELTRLHIEEVVAMAGGNVREAAGVLGVSKAALELKLRRHRMH